MPDSDRPKSAWLKTMRAAAAQAFLALPDDLREEAERGRAAAKEARAQRKAAKAAYLRQIVSMLDRGYTAAEIGQALGRNLYTILLFAGRRGIAISRSERTVRYAVQATLEQRAALRAIAAREGVDEVETLAGIVATALSGGGSMGLR